MASCWSDDQPTDNGSVSVIGMTFLSSFVFPESSIEFSSVTLQKTILKLFRILTA